MSSNTSRVANASKNIFATLSNRITIFILTFINRTFFIKYIGVEYLGIDGLFSNILNLLSMADLGLGIAMSYTYYKPLAENDTRKVAALVTFYRKVYNTIAISVAIVGLSLIPFLKYIINLDREVPHLYFCYIIALSNTVLSYLRVYKTTVITANQQAYRFTKYNVAISVIRSLIQLFIIVVPRSFIGYILCNAVITYFSNFYLSYLSEKFYPYIKNREKLDKKEAKAILINIKAVFVYRVSNVLLGGIDNIVISVLIGTVAVGYYSNYFMLAYWIDMFVVLIMNAITPSIGNVIVKGSSEEKYKVFSSLQMICNWLYALMAVAIFNLIDQFITLWIGDKFLLDMWIVGAITINIYVTGISKPLWTYRDATGLYEKTKFVMPIAAVLNLVLSFLFGKIWGLAGIIIATPIAKLVYLIYEPLLLFKIYFNRSAVKYFYSCIFNFILVLLLSISIWTIFKYINVNIFVSMILKIVIIFLSTNIIYYFEYRKTENYRYIENKVFLILNYVKKLLKLV